MSVKSLFLKVWQKARRVLLVLFLAHFVYIIALRWVDPPITITQLVSWLRGEGLKRDYVTWNEISRNAPLAIIAHEDQLFAVHNGFDWESIQKAYLNNNRKKAHITRGGSTISQQVAKNVFLFQGGGYFRKGLEAYFTFMIELIWGKQRILEMYLNVSEMGQGIYGIEAAAQSYFNKSAKYLTVNEAAMIASCLPNPKRLKVKPMSNYIAHRYPWVVLQMSYLRDDPDLRILLAPPSKTQPKTQPKTKTRPGR